MTQPTVSKHWRRVVSYPDSSQSHQAHLTMLLRDAERPLQSSFIRCYESTAFTARPMGVLRIQSNVHICIRYFLTQQLSFLRSLQQINHLIYHQQSTELLISCTNGRWDKLYVGCCLLETPVFDTFLHAITRSIHHRRHNAQLLLSTEHQLTMTRINWSRM